MIEFWEKTWSRPYRRYLGHHADVYEAVLPLLEGEVLDLGCGPCAMYKGTSIALTGVDWSLEALNQARINYPMGRYIQADVLHSGLPTGQYDTVVLMGVLDWVDDWKAVLKEAHRLSRVKVLATVLQGYKGHDWSSATPLCGNWRML